MVGRGTASVVTEPPNIVLLITRYTQSMTTCRPMPRQTTVAASRVPVSAGALTMVIVAKHGPAGRRGGRASD